MKNFSALLILFFNLLFSVNLHAGLSPLRYPNEPFHLARNRHLFSLSFDVQGNGGAIPLSRRGSAERVRVEAKKLNWEDVPELQSVEELNSYFYYIRDNRYIETWEPNFPRRPTWLYPDDGCYARAEVAKIELQEKFFTKPKKIFVFGDLIALSNNSPSGKVTWWYHVAPTFRVGKNVYVLDPALESSRPLLLGEWNSRVGGDKTKTYFSICSPEAFDPDSDCDTRHGVDKETALSEQRGFLQSEWDRLIELGRNPDLELGDSPPWL